MNKTLLISLTSLCISGTAFGTVLFSEDFESQTPGDKPAATAVRPSTNTATVFTEVVTGAANGAGGGSGNGVELFDNESGSGGAFVFENNFVPDAGSQVSAILLSYDFAWEQDLGSGDYARGGVSFYDPSTAATLNTSANIYLEIRFGGDGTFLIGGSGGNSTEGLTVNTAYSLDIFINDYDSQSINYDVPGGGTASLAANTFAAYLDGVLFREDGLENGALVGDNNLGRFGIDSFTSSVGIDYTFDNFEVSTIAVPEPSTYAVMTGVLVLGFVAYRRRRS